MANTDILDAIATALQDRIKEISPDWHVTVSPASNLQVSAVLISLYDKLIYSLRIYGNRISVMDHTIKETSTALARSHPYSRESAGELIRKQTIAVLDMNDPKSIDTIEAIILEKYKLVGRINTNADRGGTDFKCLQHHLRNNFGIIISDGMACGLTTTEDTNFMLINPMSLCGQEGPKKLAICISLLQDALMQLDD